MKSTWSIMLLEKTTRKYQNLEANWKMEKVLKNSVKNKKSKTHLKTRKNKALKNLKDQKKCLM